MLRCESSTSDPSPNAGNTVAMGANSQLSATCSVTSARSPELRQSLTAQDAVPSSRGRRLATAISRMTSVPRPAATLKNNKFVHAKGATLLTLFSPMNTTITTLFSFHGLPPIETGFSSFGFADRLAHVDHVASRQILGRVRHWHFTPPRMTCYVNHRPSRESSTHQAENYKHACRCCCESVHSTRHFTRALMRERGEKYATAQGSLRRLRAHGPLSSLSLAFAQGMEAEIRVIVACWIFSRSTLHDCGTAKKSGTQWRDLVQRVSGDSQGWSREASCLRKRIPLVSVSPKPIPQTAFRRLAARSRCKLKRIIDRQPYEIKLSIVSVASGLTFFPKNTF